MTNGIRFQSIGALSVFAIIILIVFAILLIPLVLLGLVGAAFTRLGFSWISAVAVVLLILLGSAVNIPVYTIKRDMVRVVPENATMSDPYAPWSAGQVWETVISLNLGGAIIPVLVAVYLLHTALPPDRLFACPAGLCRDTRGCPHYLQFDPGDSRHRPAGAAPDPCPHGTPGGTAPFRWCRDNCRGQCGCQRNLRCSSWREPGTDREDQRS